MASKTIAYLNTGEGKGVLTFMLLASAGVAAFLYGVGKDNGESECRALTAAKELNLPALVEDAKTSFKALREATAKFSDTVTRTEGYQELVNTNEKLKSEVISRDEQILSLTEVNKKLSASVARLQLPELTTIKYSHAEYAAEGVTVGLEKISDDAVYMTVNGIRERKSAGEQFSVQVGSKTCVVTLRRISGFEGAVSTRCD